MPYSRQRPRIAPTGRISIRLSTDQRDMFIASKETPKNLAHALHRTPVREGKLSIRVNRSELDTLITVAARTNAEHKSHERSLASLLRYLETAADRFSEDDEDRSDAKLVIAARP